MAFQFAAGDYQQIEEGDESTILAYLGHDPDTEAYYYAAVTLSPFEDHVEYSFTIIRRCRGEDQPFTSGLETKGMFETADRRAILGVISEATRRLLNWKKPALVDRCTSDANLTGKSLDKHTRITAIFGMCDYKVTDCGDWNGQKVWKAERVAGSKD